MVRIESRTAAAMSALLALAVMTSVSTAAQAQAQAPAVDPAAVQILKRMTDYLGGLQQVSVHTQNTIEDMFDWGQRVDFDVSANVIISRPNKLRAERAGDLISQTFYYDGKSLTLYNPEDKVYATVPAPATIEDTLDFARSTLGLVVPVADLVYRDNFRLLMENVTTAVVVGKAVIGGVKCDHLAFSRPGVDFQVWVADGSQPLPYKYVVTDTALAGLLSVGTIMSDWNVSPSVPDSRFAFVPPPGAKPISFLPLESSGQSSR